MQRAQRKVHCGFTAAGESVDDRALPRKLSTTRGSCFAWRRLTALDVMISISVNQAVSRSNGFIVIMSKLCLGGLYSLC